MRRLALGAAAAFLPLPLPLLALTPAHAGGYGACRAGATVVDRQGQTGIVLDDSDPAACRVRLSDGTTRSYLQWMLSPARAPAGRGGRAFTGRIVPGAYHCSGGAAGTMRITLTGPRWNSMYAAPLPDGRVGISSRPNGTPYYMVCERG